MTYAVGTEVVVLGDEHADGTIWADIENDLWTPCPFGWAVVHRGPFSITTQVCTPSATYGPYRAVLGPPPPPNYDGV